MNASRRGIRIKFKVNTRPFRKSLDEFGVEHGLVTQDEADARALGRTLEEIDEIEEPTDD